MMSLRVQHGSILKKSGAWLGRYSKWTVDPDTGEKHRQQYTFRIGSIADMPKAEARLALAARIAQETGLREDSRVTFAWFTENRWKPMRSGSWRESTAATNEHLLKLLCDKFGITALEDLDSVVMQTWLNALAKTHSASVVKHCRIFLKSICTEAQDTEYIRRNPARALRVPAGLKQPPKPYLTVEQVKKLLDKAKGMDRLLLRVAFLTALRPSELFALRWCDFQPEHKMLMITHSIWRGKLRPFTKTTDDSSRKELTRVFLPPSLVTELQMWYSETKHKHPEDHIFATEYGMSWWKENYQQRVLNPLAEAASLPRLNFQMIRRTTATLSQRLGSAKDIAGILRHTTPDVTVGVYTQQQSESVREAVEKLETLLS